MHKHLCMCTHVQILQATQHTQCCSCRACTIVWYMHACGCICVYAHALVVYMTVHTRSYARAPKCTDYTYVMVTSMSRWLICHGNQYTMTGKQISKFPYFDLDPPCFENTLSWTAAARFRDWRRCHDSEPILTRAHMPARMSVLKAQECIYMLHHAFLCVILITHSHTCVRLKSYTRRVYALLLIRTHVHAWLYAHALTRRMCMC